MPSLVPRMVFAAAPPSSTSTDGDKQLDLAGEERRAGLDLLRRRRAISRRAPIDRVGDVDVLLAEADRREHAVEQLPGAADKGLALQILVAAGASPIIMMRACSLPLAKQRLLAVRFSEQPSKLATSSCSSASVETSAPIPRVELALAALGAARGGGAALLGSGAGRGAGLRQRQRRSSRPAPRRSPRRRPWPDTNRTGPAPPFRLPPASSRPLLPQLPRYPRCVGYWIPAYAGMT